MDAQPKRLTPEQDAILEHVHDTKDNVMVEAHAGCGKTSTLEAMEKVLPKNQKLYLVFNTKNATEAAAKMSPLTEVRTMNSIGHRIWGATQRRNLVVQNGREGRPHKVRQILRDMIDAAPKPAQGAMWDCFAQIVDGVNRAKTFGYVPSDICSGPLNGNSLLTQSQFHATLDEAPDDLTADLIDAVLTRSINTAFWGQIDHADQIYMPALFKASVPRYSTVLVDEYQDLSPVDHVLVRKLIRDGVRHIGVGDTFQNIYGFRGASARGMEEAVGTYNMTTLPLTVSFRCPEEIVKHVHWRVPAFKAIKSGGSVHVPNSLDHDDIPDGATVICRNNAPLFALAIRFFTHGRAVTIAGSDIGPRIIGTMRKLGPETLTRAQAVGAIGEWLTERLEAESKSAPEIADCMRVFCEHGSNLGEAIRYAEHLLKAEGKVLLTTGHKAKGLEWDHVFHLDPWLVRKGDTDEQNKNLDYVISTRSANRLVEIDSEKIVWPA